MRHIVPIVAFLTIFAGCSQNTAPVANSVTITGPKIGLPGNTYEFTATPSLSTNAMVFFRWSIDDSTFTIGPLVQFSKIAWAFKTVGNHIIRVHVLRTGDNTELCSSSDTVVIASLQLSIQSSEARQLTFTTYKAIVFPAFDSSCTINWSFDGNKFVRSRTDTASFIFLDTGVHTVYATYSDHLKNSVSDTIQINVKAIPITITYLPTEPKVNSPILFTASFPSVQIPVQLYWYFSDGTSATTDSFSISHTFSYSGSKSVSASIKASNRTVNSSSINLSVKSDIVTLDTASFSNYHHATVSFWGKFAPMFSPSECMEDYFVNTENISISSKSISGAFNALLSEDRTVIDSLNYNTNTSWSNIQNCGYPWSGKQYGQSCKGHRTVILHNIPILFATPDSVGFGIAGTDMNSLVAFTASGTWVHLGCSAGTSGQDDINYLETDWSAVPSAFVRVVLYR